MVYLCILIFSFSKIFSEVVNFTYSGETGLQYWSHLSPSYAACSKRNIQYPINIETNDVIYNPTLMKGVGSVIIDGNKYNLLQTHWHSLSDIPWMELEIFLVHKSDDNTALYVISILYRLREPNSFLSQKLRICIVKKVHIKLVRTEELERTVPYYRYLGSLTTPCNEQVIWIIIGQVREISEQQVTAIKVALGKSYQKNARPLQQLNGRRVEDWK
ncbi:hypothetical protein MKX03_015415 [Papaver bracteatum]|nr:hypothetical protein MKX03_015415 [Papaver bracteatum]